MIEVDRARRVAALTTTAHRLHHGWPPLRRLHTARLRRLALAADEAMVAEARSRVDRVHRIVALTAPTAGGDDPRVDMAAVSGPDTDTDRGPDIDSSDEPDMSAVSARTPTQTRARTPRPSTRTSRGADTAAAVTRLRAAHPDMTAGEIARQIGVTDRTVRRHLPRPDPATVPTGMNAGMNGHAAPSRDPRAEDDLMYTHPPGIPRATPTPAWPHVGDGRGAAPGLGCAGRLRLPRLPGLRRPPRPRTLPPLRTRPLHRTPGRTRLPASPDPEPTAAPKPVSETHPSLETRFQYRTTPARAAPNSANDLDRTTDPGKTTLTTTLCRTT